MNNNYFMYIIRSTNKLISTDNNNDCTYRINGLPSNIKKFEVEFYDIVTDFSVLNANDIAIEIRSSDFGIISGFDTLNKSLNTIGFKNTIGHNSLPYIFSCDNFNFKTVRIQLYNKLGTPLLNINGTAYNSNYSIILKMRGIE